MNLQTGEKEAKLLEKDENLTDESAKSSSVLVSQEDSTGNKNNKINAILCKYRVHFSGAKNKTWALFHYDIAILRSIAMSTQTVLPVS